VAWSGEVRHGKEFFVNRQEQQQQAYKQRLAEQERIKQQTADQQRLALKAQFQGQRRREDEQRHQLDSVQSSKEALDKEEAAIAHQRLTDGQRRIDEQRRASQNDAQALIKQRKMQEAKVWVGWDDTEFRSPGEQAFWDVWKVSGYQDEIPLIPQYRIGRYRPDFVDTESMSCIEIDGRAYHTDRYSFTNDRQRERALKKLGWDFIRFSNDEVTNGVEGVVAAAYEFICERRNKVR
jgi:very-short-patch-repair endonuclease